ncbi:MAG: SMP-30/gluconolactonase/LRE family protein [Verrucomicrobiota bacterium]
MKRSMMWLAFVLACAFPAASPAQNLAGDEALSKVLIDGEDWKLVAEGYSFTDSACADAEGNFYFTDVSKGTTINKISPDGKVSALLENVPRISGLKFGPDGRLYACTQGPSKQVVAFELPSGKMTVLADHVQPNDLVVTHKGDLYFTETAKRQVTLIQRNGAVRAVDAGIKAPNGITLSPDQGTLAVSDYIGTNVWVFRIDADGGLSAKAPYMDLRTPLDKPEVSNGDGMTTDTAGRYYVTSSVGIQMFDATGRMGGVIAKPQNKGCVSVAFAGPGLSYLYACCTDKVYRRKTQAKGALFFQPLPR